MTGAEIIDQLIVEAHQRRALELYTKAKNRCAIFELIPPTHETRRIMEKARDQAKAVAQEWGVA